MQKYLKKHLKNKSPQIKFKTNFANCILQCLQSRGYQQTQGDDWDIIWSEKQYISELYQKRLTPSQRINHFKNYFQLCKKDCLVRNLKKHKKALEREGKPAEVYEKYDFWPTTFVLPSEYVLFADEFKKQSPAVWIMKPTGKSQGKGIFLFNKLQHIAAWEHPAAEQYIVQKYLHQPLLIGGKKFDLRLYVLVVSYNPLTVYFYRGGFARFTHCRYEENKIQQSQMHLTNVAVQKNTEGYDEGIGGKWYMDKLKCYLLSKYGEECTHTCLLKIQSMIVKTLEAMCKVMGNDRPQSFELYGFDVLLDARLTPWLIEVNGSPSMTANTPTDKQFKINLLDDTLTVLDIQKHLMGGEEQIGGFDLLCKAGTFKKKKYSFLGTCNNREDNLKRLAKAYAPRINSMHENTSNNKGSCNGNKVGEKSKNDSKGKKQYKAAISNTSSIAQSNVSIKPLQVKNIPQSKKGFVIKKIKRQLTNQN